MVKKGDEDIDCEYWRSELFKTKSVNLKERNIRYEFFFLFYYYHQYSERI